MITKEKNGLKFFCYAEFPILRTAPKRECSNLAREKKSLANPVAYPIKLFFFANKEFFRFSMVSLLVCYI
jgi:hypothetical protein